MAQFEPAIEKVLKHEGGFQKGIHDPGNWIGGRAVMEQYLQTSDESLLANLRGTNFGISAMSYPNEDIENLTVDRAKEIYERDFWLNGQYGDIADQDVATKLLDLAVTMERFGRHGPAVTMLQEAICACGGAIDVDGSMGPRTIAAANAVPGDQLLQAVKNAAVTYYNGVVASHPDEARFLEGWTIRALS